MKTIVHDATEVVTYADHRRIDTIADASVVIEDGTVLDVGPAADIRREYPTENADETVDAAGQAVVPGLVDPHTHAVFAGERSDEFEAKLRGKSYNEILEDGGGILRTVRATREADTETLVENLLTQLDVMLAHGTTTVEVKSGYGLDVETELKMLEAVEAADDRHPIDLVSTFIGAHAVPEDQDTASYVDDVIDRQIPAVAEAGVAEFCDVFCEAGIFDVDQSRRILDTGQGYGLKPKVHAEELSHLGGTQLAADVGATSADHLLHSTREDVRALTDAGVSPVLLPGTAFGLGADYADAGMFLDEGTPVALATDFNPNCYSQSMPFAMSLACVEMGMTPAQALGAATRNAALALDRDDGSGTLTPGSPGDLAILSGPSHVYLTYQFGVNPVDCVVKGGHVYGR
jgi:imidazolonepropionase